MTKSGQKHRPDIDGLRAVAIVPVVLFHAGLTVFSGGYVGVDVFFVISGYLITSLILHDLKNDEFSFIEFWMRRARRILPALFVVVMFTLVAGWIVLFPTAYRDLGRSAMTQSFFASNVFFWLKSGYFAAPSETKPLLHTWSVSVEEQFYLFIPLTLFLLVRYMNRFRELAIAVLLLASFLVSAWSAKFHPDAAFYLMPARAWELLVGSLLAMLALKRTETPSHQVWGYELLSVLGLASILLAVIGYSNTTRFPGFAALAPCLGAAAIIWCNDGRLTLVGRILAHRWVAWIGLISYSLYLWHWPLLAFARSSMPERLPVVAAIAIASGSILAGWLSYKYVETPVRKKPVFYRRAVILPASAAALLVMCAAGFSVSATGGASGREAFQASTFERDITPTTRRDDLCTAVASANLPAFVCRLGIVSNARPKVLLIGDSFAGMYLPAFERLSGEYDREVWYIREPNRNVYSGVLDVSTSRDISHVVLSYSWKRAIRSGIPELVPQAISASDSRAPSRMARFVERLGFDPLAVAGDTKAEFRANLKVLVKTLVNRGIEVWIIDAPPYYDVSVPLKLGLIVKNGGDPAKYGSQLSGHVSELSYIHSVFREVEADKVHIITVTDILCDSGGFCRSYLDGHSLYSDDAHLSDFGVAQIVPLLKPAFEQAPLTGPVGRPKARSKG